MRGHGGEQHLRGHGGEQHLRGHGGEQHLRGHGGEQRPFESHFPTSRSSIGFIYADHPPPDMYDPEMDSTGSWSLPAAFINMVSACAGSIARFVKSFMPVVTLLVCHTPVAIHVDTGAQLNIIDEATFNRLAVRPVLQKCKTTLFGYNTRVPIATVGQFETRVIASGSYRTVSFVVTQGNGGNLLSYRTACELGIMSSINNIECPPAAAQSAPRADQQAFDKWRQEFPGLFSGKIGQFNKHLFRLHIDKSVEPVQAKLRTVAIRLRQGVEKEIKNMLEQDLIEPANGPTPWVSAIVPVRKPNGDVRICVDARAANKAIQRSRFLMPTIDDLVVKMNNARFITKIDLKAGYNQLVIEPECRYITTFATHLGLYQFKRLTLGINASSELFQKAIANLICGIPKCINFSDDIIVHGATQEEHDDNVRELLRRLSGAGMTLNGQKCEFSQRELDFYGLHFADTGMSIQKQKLDALLSAAPPKNASEVRSLGLANYCTRFIPNLATTCAPLSELTKTSVKFEWTAAHDAALESLKLSLTSDVVKYFRPDWHTVLHVDASPVGLGAVLTQEDPNDRENRHVVQYASRSLTDVERRYHQVER